MKTSDFLIKKIKKEKISVVTCYDYTYAKILSESDIDCLLVGDSAAMIMHGFKDTLAATIDMMTIHTSAVHRGANNKFIVTDMPFLSFRKSHSKTIEAAEKLMRAGAAAIKIEGAKGNLESIQYLIESGIPVMGHLGFTMQYKYTMQTIVQGKTDDSAKRLEEESHQLEEAGCFAVVLECIPSALANRISQALRIPTIGIGAGNGTDGQVLVLHDLLGLNNDFKPKFVKHFMDGSQQVNNVIQNFINEIKTGEFPNHEHCY